MKYRIEFVALVLSVLYLQGCAQIEITVDAANPSKVEEANSIQQLVVTASRYAAEDDLDRLETAKHLMSELRETESRLQEHYHNKASQLAAELEQIADADAEAPRRQALSTRVEQLRQLADSPLIDPAYFQDLERWIDLYPEYTRQVRAGLRGYRETGSLASLEQLRTAVHRRETIEEGLIEGAEQEIESAREAIEGAKPEIESANETTERARSDTKMTSNTERLDEQINIAQAALTRLRRPITAGTSLVGTGISWPLLSIPDEAWEERFNRAFGRGVFGNSDIVLIMDNVAQFSVKGMSFDPSSVAAAASKISSQMLIYLTQFAGAPLPTGTLNDTSGSAYRLPDESINQAENALASAERLRTARESALYELGALVLRHSTGMEQGASSAEQVTSSTADILAAFEELRPILEFRTPSIEE